MGRYRSASCRSSTRTAPDTSLYRGGQPRTLAPRAAQRTLYDLVTTVVGEGDLLALRPAPGGVAIPSCDGRSASQSGTHALSGTCAYHMTTVTFDWFVYHCGECGEARTGGGSSSSRSLDTSVRDVFGALRMHQAYHFRQNVGSPYHSVRGEPRTICTKPTSTSDAAARRYIL